MSYWFCHFTARVSNLLLINVLFKPLLSVYTLGRMNLYADLTLGIPPKSLRIPQKFMRLLCWNLCGRRSVKQGEVTEISIKTLLFLTVALLVYKCIELSLKKLQYFRLLFQFILKLFHQLLRPDKSAACAMPVQPVQLSGQHGTSRAFLQHATYWCKEFSNHKRW